MRLHYLGHETSVVLIHASAISDILSGTADANEVKLQGTIGLDVLHEGLRGMYKAEMEVPACSACIKAGVHW